LGKRHEINCGVIGNILGTLQKTNWEHGGNKKIHTNFKPHPVTLLPSPKRKRKTLMNACEVSLAA
jgi:hypothetical protein